QPVAPPPPVPQAEPAPVPQPEPTPAPPQSDAAPADPAAQKPANNDDDYWGSLFNIFKDRQ
ncbi:MAG: hypothetical protein IJQ25_08315, partial [Oscillibacter sp.]|nr:hypothetical protein [Oscillibacter sp.]